MKRVLAAAAVVLALTAACGDSDTTPTATPRPGTPTSSPDTPAPTTTSTLPGPTEQLLYARTDHSLWLYNTATGEDSEIVPSGVCPAIQGAEWSPSGERLAFTCGPGVETDVFVYEADGTLVERLARYSQAGWSPDSRYLVLTKVPDDPQSIEPYGGAIREYDDSGTPLGFSEIEGAVPAFSPGGRMLVFYRAPDAACAPSCATGLTIRHLDDGTEQTYGDLLPLDWVLDRRTLVTLEDTGGRRENVAEADVILLDADSGERTDALYLRGFFQMWVAATGEAVIGTRYPGLTVVDLETQTVSLSNGKSRQFEIDPFVKHCLLNGLDDVSLTLQESDKIASFEESRPSFLPRTPAPAS